MNKITLDKEIVQTGNIKVSRPTAPQGERGAPRIMISPKYIDKSS